jgi:hypothetical protein
VYRNTEMIHTLPYTPGYRFAAVKSGHLLAQYNPHSNLPSRLLMFPTQNRLMLMEKLKILRFSDSGLSRMRMRKVDTR